MKKLIILFVIVLSSYFFLKKKKHIVVDNQNAIESTTEAANADVKKEFRDNQLPQAKSTLRIDENLQAASTFSQHHSDQKLLPQEIPLKSKDLPYTESENAKQIKKFEQIVPEYGDFEATPKILTENSARVFSLFDPFDLIPNLEIGDIRTAFANGTYPTKEIIKTLRLDDIFNGTLYIDYELKYNLVWSLQIDKEANPVVGVFSLHMNEVEKSCNATSKAPLKNIALLANDKGTILIKSCDESFYMQLFRNSANSLSGIYYQRDQNGNYKAFKDHNLSFYRKSRND